MVNTKIKLSNLVLDNPIIPASGTFGFGKEFSEIYDINILGSFCIKGTTKNERFGNPTPRIAECKNGLINSVGLQNPGVDHVIKYELQEIKKYFQKKIIANVSGFNIDEYLYTVSKFDKEDNVGIIEINISCPNVKNGGMSFGQDPKTAYEITKKIKENTKKPIYIKLSPNVTNITKIAKACEDAGADGISLINTLMGMRIDIRTKKPIIKNVYGGYSGPGVFPVALKMVYEVYKAIEIPIIGMGGISNCNDVIEMMLAGATACQIGSLNLIDPFGCKKIIEELPKKLNELGVKDINEIIGGAHNG